MRWFVLLPLVFSFCCFSAEEQGDVSSLLHQVEDLKEIVHELGDKVNRQQSELSELRRENQELKVLSNQNTRLSYPRTCLELMENEPGTSSGLYYVDPDGSNSGDPPIYVFCYSNGHTAIVHDSANKINVGHCFDPGCYSRPVVYNATMRQITALMELSSGCYQTIRYDCTSAPIAFNGIQYGWWNDPEDNPHYYWDGSEDIAHTCQCGLQGNCADPTLTCNCDASAPVALFDAGTIRNLKHLPISRLNFGRTSPEASSGEHTLGYMQCFGRFNGPPSGKPSSCADLWRMSTTVSGIYLVQREDGQVLTVYCNMTKLPSEEGQERIIGYNDIKSSLVFFDAYRSTDTAFSFLVTYDGSRYNVGGAMNISTGYFTAPVKGIYSFTFNGLAGSDVTVSIRVNSFAWSSAEGTNNESVTLSSLIPLDIGDSVFVAMEKGTLYASNNTRPAHFQGYLVEEDLI